jgi:CubicO group peptidase (beta-lactamase class C family)
MPAARLVLLLAIVPVAAPAQQFAPDRGVDSVFAEYDRNDVPGCAVGVYRDGQLKYARGYGMADLERRVPITPHTVFDIGSTSKQFTAAVITLLAQEGKLALDDDIRRYIPEIPAYQRPITIRHLLHHTSGIRDYLGLLRLAGFRYDDVTTADDALRAIARQRALNFAPGDEYLYSNSGYFLLSIIVERVTGRSLREEARDRIFAPLGMTRTHYLGSYDDIVPDRAIGHSPADSGFTTDVPRWLQLGDGAVFTTVEELGAWEENFRSGRVGGVAMRDTMHTRGRLTNGTEIVYALGLMHGTHRGLKTVFHGGSWGGYVAELLRFPEQRYGVAVLCNRSDADTPGLALRVAEVHLASQMTPVATVASASTPAAAGGTATRPLATYVGSYRVPNSGMLVTVTLGDSGLRVVEPVSAALLPTGADRFSVAGIGMEVELRFEVGTTPGARATLVEEIVAGRPGNRYQRMAELPPLGAGIAAYVGTYRSEELETTIEITRADSTLQFTSRNSRPRPLRAVGVDEFFGAGNSLIFTRDAAGAVTGMTLSQGRMKNLGFVKVGS